MASNDAWVRLVMTGHMTTELYAKIDLLFEQALQEKSPVKELVRHTSDSTEKLGDAWNVTVFPINENETLVALGCFIDIAPCGLSTKCLESSSKQEQLLLEHLPIAYCMTEVLFDENENPVDYVFLQANPSFEHMTGLKNVIGKHVKELIPGVENDPSDWIGRCGRVVKENFVDRFSQFSQPLGRWYNGLAYHSQGNCIVWLFVDHSEHFAMEQAVRESEERHRTLFENMKQGVVYHDATGVTTDANESALQILGLTKEQLVGKAPMDPQWRLLREDGSMLPINEYPVVIALQGKPVTSKKYGLFDSMRNRIRWIQLDAMPRFRDGESTPYQAFTIFTDITESRQVEDNLIRAKEMAEEADQLKSGECVVSVVYASLNAKHCYRIIYSFVFVWTAFLATMSHEIRTPLNGIMGHVDLILSNELAEEDKEENMEGLQIAMDSGRLLIQIIEDILDLSKIEAGQLDIVHRPFLIKEMVQNTVNLANAYRIQRKKVNIEIIEDLDESVPPGIYGDQFRIQQVLNNLLSNAIKFTDEGRVELSIRRGNVAETLEFSVQDTGKGIPEDRLGMIFEPFRQVEIGDTRKHGGTGLGLTICKKLVSMMGGDLCIHSSTEGLDRGSRFFFSLPFEPCEKLTISQNMQTPHHLIHIPRLSRKSGKILLAEDDRVSRKIAVSMLKKAGFEVLEAGDGVEAVSMYVQNRRTIDLVLMDVMMPNMDGLEATKRIREIESRLPECDSVPIVALSAGAMKGDREKGLEVGMTDYLYKPISIQQLKEALERCLGIKRQS